MHCLKLTFVFICLFWSSSSLLNAQHNQDLIDQYLSKKFNDGPGASILISKNFIPFYTLQKGALDLENHLPIQDTSLFRIGSITKQFTAVAILKLVEEGKIDLKAPIQTYLPTFPQKRKMISVEHLLTHTSGLVDITEAPNFLNNLAKRNISPKKLVDYFKEEPLVFNPGDAFMYCNSGYHLLGLIIESVSNQTYGSYLEENLFQPASLKFTMEDNNRTIIPTRIKGYDLLDENIVNTDYIDMIIPYSAGNLLSNTQDINQWYKSLFDGKIISKGTLNKAHENFILNNGRPAPYGYGWFITQFQGEKVIQHSGSVNGFSSNMIYLPSQQLLTVVLTNCSCYYPTFISEKITAYAMNKPFEERKEVVLSKKDLMPFLGIYSFQNYQWNFTLVGENLVVQFPEGLKWKLSSAGNNVFFSEDWNGKIVFEQNENEVMQMHLFLGQREIVALKTK